MKINNSLINQELIRAARIEAAAENATSFELDKNINGTIEVNPTLVALTNLVNGASGLNTASVTIHTCSTAKDTYLCSAELFYEKSVGATAVDITLNVILDGEATSRILINLGGITATASRDSQTIVLNHPILLKKGSIIAVICDDAAPAIRTGGAVTGFTIG